MRIIQASGRVTRATGTYIFAIWPPVRESRGGTAGDAQASGRWSRRRTGPTGASLRNLGQHDRLDGGAQDGDGDGKSGHERQDTEGDHREARNGRLIAVNLVGRPA